MDSERYDAAVAALFARQPARMVPDLDRIRTLCQLLGQPEQAYPAIQLTGTNGKTTTAHMIVCLLGALGLKAGAYTSPHLQDVRERIRVGPEPISREDVVEGLEYLEPFVAEVDSRYPDPVTFFEILTGLAYTHFADKPVDVGVFEVGMGGRWDATNLVRGETAVVGPIGLDHVELGSTVEQVAAEKAGVFKKNAVVVSAEQEPGVADVLERAAEDAGASMVTAGRDFAVASRELAVGGQYLDLRGVSVSVDGLYVPLHGVHQAANAACAVAAVEGFLGFAGGLDPDVIRTGFSAVRSPGRLEVVRREDASTVVLDGAHNLAGARSLVSALREEFAFRHRVFVLGMLGDKEVEAIIDELAPISDHVVVTTPPGGRTAPAPAERLEKALRATGRTTVETADDVGSAIELASGLAEEEDAVVVTGSLYTVGAARTALGLEPA